MPDLLLELFSEEIPARMQAQAAADLKRLVTDALVAAGLLYEGAQSFVTPRRLALQVAGLPARQPDIHEERRGPRVGAPEAAIAGFLKSAGLSSIAEAKVVEDKKGASYVAHIHREGRSTPEVVAGLMPGIVRGFPWPKSMRWGATSSDPDTLRWVRPLQSILCVFGAETEDPEVVRFEVGGIASGDETRGHRFMAPAPIRVRRFDDYVPALEAARVVLDAGRRADIIRHDARDLAFAAGLEVVEDEALLAEVSGLVEWPVVMMGRFDPAFLAIPPEVIRATIRANQKCFVTRRPDGSGRTALADRFVLVSNIVASDGGDAIVAGNERVVRARLSDARFFWESDLGTRLEDRAPKLDSIVFHEKLGTQGERVRRIMALARDLAPQVGADAGEAERAALLAKADLVSDMVGEFPELQGLMGRYYAQAQGEAPAVAAAVEDHYRPQGPSDRVPADPVSTAVALADKLDTLIGFWAIDEKPTGSKDPFALRRAALGVIRIVIENGLRLRISELSKYAYYLFLLGWQRGRVSIFLRDRNRDQFITITTYFKYGEFNRTQAEFDESHQVYITEPEDRNSDSRSELTLGFSSTLSRREIKAALPAPDQVAMELMSFLADRLKVYLRDKGARHDLIDAVFALPGQDDLVLIVRRVEALGAFLDTEDGRNLLGGYRRAANILRAEEKRDGAGAFEAAHTVDRLVLPEERDLAAVLSRVEAEVAERAGAEDFEGAMRSLASLRASVDSFFERVTVNADDPDLRLNRLRLLAGLRRTMQTVALFDRVAG